MKPAAGCAFLLCFFLLLGGFGALIVLKQIRPAGFDAPPPPVPPDPNKYLSWVESLHQFRRTETADRYDVTYGFIDYSGKKHQVTCAISKNDYEKDRTNYGYIEKELDAAVDAQLQKFIDQEIRTRRISAYMTVKFHDGGGYHWEWKLPGGMDPQEEKRAQNAIDKVLEILKKEVPTKQDEFASPLYKDKGFLRQKNVIDIDYKQLVLRSEPELTNCFEAIHNSGRGYNERQYVGLYLAFLQEIRYEVPPVLDGERHILGLWVPTEVVANNHGDCDSKSVTFAALCKRLGVPLIVIEIPKHVLVGVQATPGPGQEYVRVGNRYFVLCEPAGPAKLYPGNEGRKDIAGNFEYTLIEPTETLLVPDQRGS